MPVVVLRAVQTLSVVAGLSSALDLAYAVAVVAAVVAVAVVVVTVVVVVVREDKETGAATEVVAEVVGSAWAGVAVVDVAAAAVAGFVAVVVVVVVHVAVVVVLLLLLDGPETAGTEPVVVEDQRRKERYRSWGRFEQMPEEGCFGSDWGWRTEQMALPEH